MTHAVTGIRVSSQPRIILLPEFLSHQECDHLIEVAKAQMAPSQLINSEAGHNYSAVEWRNSTGCFLPYAHTPVLAEVEARIASVIGLPVQHGECMQVLNYQIGQYYKPHYDFFAPGHSGHQEILSTRGQRVATFLLYLTTVEQGGETHFPEMGIKFQPIKGNVVLFYNILPDGEVDLRTLHASLPVESGEKWVATKWVCANPAC